MGFGGMSPGSILLIIAIIVVLFGGNRLAQVGQELGKALKNFRKELNQSEDPPKKPE